MGLRIVRGGGREGGSGSGSRKALEPSPYFKAMPAMWEFLTVTAWEDGEIRTTGTILYFAEEGRLKACVSDRDSERVAFVTAGTWEELNEAIEEGVELNSLDWRQSTRGRSGGRKG